MSSAHSLASKQCRPCHEKGELNARSATGRPFSRPVDPVFTTDSYIWDTFDSWEFNPGHAYLRCHNYGGGGDDDDGGDDPSKDTIVKQEVEPSFNRLS
jgi:hypothetical protein